MIKFGKWVVRNRVWILILSVLLLIPSTIGFIRTRINYDILSYLPGEIETMKGQDLLMEEFGTGAFSFVIVEEMDDPEARELADKISDIDHVKKVLWYGTVADGTIPREILPDDVYQFFNNDQADSQLMMVMFDDTMGSDGTMAAIDEMNQIVGKQCFVSGMAAVNADTKTLVMKEAPIYVAIAALLSLLIMGITMDSIMVPVLFLLSIGMAIVYNLGTNQLQGQISYLTMALAAVLQLAVTMDYSIFLWHSYNEQKIRFDGDKQRAMAHAISGTITSVAGSSVTTIAGFVALCFMTFTLGLDLGIVMAKGVVIGVICCVTVLPSMILICDKAIEKTMHKVWMPDLTKIASWITNHSTVFLVAFLIILVPAIYGYTHNEVYYDLAGTMPESALSKVANDRLNEQYQMGATHMVIAPRDMSSSDSICMINEMKEVDGVKLAASLDSLTGGMIPEEFLPEKVTGELKGENYQMMLIISEYPTASDAVNEQIRILNKIVGKYSNTAMLIGEAPCTKDLIEITNTDFQNVSIVSIGVIFLIILLIFKSVSLPLILVATIEFAIFINMGIPTYTGTVIPFIASVVIGTIQLGATVDYAILLTNKYKKNRTRLEMDKKQAVTKALQDSIQSIFVSALCFFAATFGVGMFADVDMISSLCVLLASGAIISMFVVILVLPSMLMFFDGIIRKTSLRFQVKK